MEIEIQFTDRPIAETILPPGQPGAVGAWLEFRGKVRGEENSQTIRAIEYEAYPEMAGREIRLLLQEISARHPCRAAKVIHRVGVIPVGETAIYVGVASPHRGEAIALLAEFMDRLKQDVPVWKRRALPAHFVGDEVTSLTSKKIKKQSETPHVVSYKSIDEAMAEIRSRSRPLPAVRTPLAEALGRVLRETICAPEDLPPVDRSTRDGYAIRADDASKTFSVMDTIHAADWKPRQLKSGEAVRVATGAALPCSGLRVVMQEHVKREGDKLHVVRRENSTNIRLRGEDVRQGRPLVSAGTKLNAGALAILATVGNVNPLVSPRLRILHFTTGDEIVAPDQTPKPGQIRDSNSILIRSLLQNFSCDLEQGHLPEHFELAKSEIENRKSQIENADVLLVSGGASVGEKDLTRTLLEQLGFEIVFSQINLRPGRPLIFGVNGGASVPASRTRQDETSRSRLVSSLAPPNKVRVAFGLPGNPLSHFVCFHFAVATALAGLTGGEPPEFLRGQLAEKLDDKPCPRETLWPARWEWRVGQTFLSASSGDFPVAGADNANTGQECPANQQTGMSALRPLAWASSGDITCLAAANALVRVPANQGSIEKFAGVDFLPVTAMIGGGL
jgi:molybdopterin molybdotransferase